MDKNTTVWENRLRSYEIHFLLTAFFFFSFQNGLNVFSAFPCDFHTFYSVLAPSPLLGSRLCRWSRADTINKVT